MWQLNVMSYVRTIQAALAGTCASAARRDRERLVDGGEASVDGDAELLGHEGRRALAVAAGRRPVRRGRHPLQRGHAGPDRDGRVARRGRARRPAGRRSRRGARRRSAPAGRSAGSRSPRRSPP